MTDELEKEGGQTIDVEGPQSGGEVAPSSDNIPDWLFRLDHVFGAVVRDLRAGLREAAHEIMRLDTGIIYLTPETG